MKKIRIGSGAGYAGDRLEPSLELIEKGNLDYISYECLAERTIAIGQQAKLKDPSKGYNELLEYRMEKALPLCHKHHVKLITNMGSANPEAAARKCVEIAEKYGLKGMKIACVTGDDMLPVIHKYMDTEVWEIHAPLKELQGEIVSANAYMGAAGIIKALEGGADVVITGRVSDPAIFMAPLIYEFGWSMDDWDKLGKGTMVGHLLECGGQVTGGYFAEPGKKEVPGLGHLGFPIAEVSEDGSFVITKVPEAGGMVTVDTCAEQICYEIHDPENYFTPDVVADFKNVRFTETGKDVVKAEGATGKKYTDTLKCSIGYKDCFIGSGEISYGGPGCLRRAELAVDILKERIDFIASGLFDELKYDIIGVNSLYGGNGYIQTQEPSEVRVRMAGRAKTKEAAALIGNEVEALYTNGPAGGGGAVKGVKEIISVCSILVNRNDVTP
ncbi:MAG: DUF1446 domain-containing protein, partial [Parasporobacterium sp.]|nr:DUF1446 domain-containing protein [Parasporobacterium sp.]